jgi:5-methylcytosine-specific restriction protein B
MSKVWRVGTNWDGTPLRDIFAKHKIAFAGQDVQRRMNEVEIGDLVGIGSGVRVIGVGAVSGKCKLSDTTLPDHEEFGSDLVALKFDPLIWDDACGIASTNRTSQFFQDRKHESEVRTYFRRAIQHEMKNKLEHLLRLHFQLILTGAPGTGKTHLARELAAQIIGVTSPEQIPKSQFEFVQFHPSYDYSDFVQGLKPVPSSNGQIAFELQPGIFKRFCASAQTALEEDRNRSNSEPRRFVFIIDEINRADLSRVFGELFFAIEPDYRDKTVRLQQYSSFNPTASEMCVPKNVYIIGTMNDIDRSVESLDFALRRRFVWQEIPADEPCFERVMNGVFGEGETNLWEEAKRRYRALNDKISTTETLDDSYKIGPAYFRKLGMYKENPNDMWNELWANHLFLLLREYLRGVPEREVVLEEMQVAYKSASK